ncbi:glycosyltransferase [Paenibacillus aurantiacus]|uniref:Glycosyltransferase n=1 Tax=Paenibacillus aurantiacus TaxID=1936118 RepID=A0ABV5KIL0_9BACL
MKPKISIIVPIYNMERYLERCMDSLTNQRLADVQIVAVNDGSTDRSLDIARRYAAADKRIIVLDKRNGGVSDARNAGMAAAEGDYIGFVDPDDWVDPDMYEAMYAAANAEGADIVMCGYVREFGTHAKEKVFDAPDTLHYSAEEVRRKMVRRLVGPLGDEVGQPELLDAWGTVWSKIYRADMLRSAAVRFVDLQRIGSNEDSLFNMYASYEARSFVFLNRPFYHYWRANEASATSRRNPKLAEQFQTLFGLIEAFIQEKRLGAEFEEALANRIALSTLGLGLNIVAGGRPGAAAISKVRAIHGMLSQARIRRAFDRFELARCPLPWRAFFICAKYRMSPVLYVLLEAAEYLRKTKR